MLLAMPAVRDLCVEKGYELDGCVYRLLTRCVELSTFSGEFKLSSRDAGRILGIRHDSAYRLVQMLIVDNVIEVVEEAAGPNPPTFILRRDIRDITTIDDTQHAC